MRGGREEIMNLAKLTLACVAPVLAGSAWTAHASTFTVNSTDSVYNYGGTNVAGSGSTAPQQVAIAAGTISFTFSASGQVSLTPLADPFGPHGPDGGPNAFNMNVSAAAGLSGVHSSNVGYLAAVFLNGSEPMDTAPATLDFAAANGESFASISPLLDQVFFVGDGLTGSGSGTAQQFYVPTGATTLVLGIVDADNYNGAPGAYFDNSGFYTVNVTPQTPGVPEPASWALMSGGFGLVGGALRRRAGGTVSLAA